MSEAFTERERDVMAGLVRVALRKKQRAAVRLAERHGADYDATAVEAKVALLESIYRKIGKDPARITSLHQ